MAGNPGDDGDKQDADHQRALDPRKQQHAHQHAARDAQPHGGAAHLWAGGRGAGRCVWVWTGRWAGRLGGRPGRACIQSTSSVRMGGRG